MTLKERAYNYASYNAPDYPDVGWGACYEKMETAFMDGYNEATNNAINRISDAFDIDSGLLREILMEG